MGEPNDSASVPELVEIQKADARYRERTGERYFAVADSSSGRMLFYFQDGTVMHTPVAALAHMLRGLRAVEDPEVVPECAN